MLKKNPIRLKIILLIFITLIPLSILKTTEIRKSFKLSKEAELQSCQDFAEAINVSFMNFLNRTWESQYAIGKAIAANPQWSSKDLENYLKDIASEDKSFIRCSWTNSQGVIVFSSDPAIINKSIGKLEFMQQIFSGKDKFIDSMRISPLDNELVIHIARAIRVDGELKGIIINAIAVDNIGDFLPSNRVGKGSMFGLVDKNAHLVFVSNIIDLPIEKRKISADSPARQALAGQIVKTFSRQSTLDNTNRMGVDYPLKDIGWSCFVTTSVDELLAQEKKELFQNIGVFILIFIGSFLLAIFISGKFVKSIDKLKAAAHQVMKGDLTAKVGVDEKDDLGEVSLVFDKMTESLSKRVKEVEEYNNLKSQFLSTMSHELKTPLNIILGCVQLLEKLDLNDAEKFKKLFDKYTKMQRQNSYRLLRLINNIVDVTKLEDNHIIISPHNEDIVRVVEDITLSVVEYTNLKNLTITFDTDVEEKIIAFDVDVMERIVLNLLSNAIKFTKAGGNIWVNIFDKGEYIEISVKDNGIGIPSDKLDMIFDRFTQVDNSLRRKSEGSGIGLSLVKALIELHGGAVSVASELNYGSMFTITLPNKTVDVSEASVSEKGLSRVERVHVEFSDIYMQ